MKKLLGFPCVYTESKVCYTEVKKPTGVQYMLLVLINESKNKSRLMASQLESFGVPESLQGIYFNELENMIKDNIIELVDLDSDMINSKISNFKFTEMGAKIFKNEFITTGKLNNIQTTLYFNHVMNTFYHSSNSDFDYRLPEEKEEIAKLFSGYLSTNSSEDFFKINKGRPIPLKIPGMVKTAVIRKEEEIIKVEDIKKEIAVGYANAKMSFNGDEVDIQFEKPEIQKFFEKNYKKEWFNFFSLHNFNYEYDKSKIYKFSDLKFSGVPNILNAEQCKAMMAKKHHFILSREVISNSFNSIVVGNSIDELGKPYEVIYKNENGLFGLAVGLFTFTNKTLGPVNIPVGLECPIEEDDLYKVSRDYLKKNSLDDDSLIYVINILKDTTSAEEFFLNKEKHSAKETIDTFSSLKDKVANKNFMKKYYLQSLNKIYWGIVNSSTIKNAVNNILLTSHLVEELKVDEVKAIKIYKPLLSNFKDFEAYDLLAQNGFSAIKLVPYFNPIPSVLNGRKSLEPSIQDFMQYNDRINSINLILGIHDVSNYLIDFDEIDRKEFKKQYSSLITLRQKADIFRLSNKEVYEGFDSLENIYKRTIEYINDMEVASFNIEHLRKDMVDRQIANGEYLSAFAYLGAKLEDVLRRHYKAKGSGLNKLIDSAKGIESSVSILHEFRQKRNSIIHVDKLEVKNLTRNLNTWCEVIFGMEKKNESKSSN